MKAVLLLDRRDEISENAFTETKVWRVPRSVPGSAHSYKYSFAYVVDGVCVLRYDNESGKGYHRHYGGEESPVAFQDIGKLLADFAQDIRRWNNENGRA